MMKAEHTSDSFFYFDDFGHGHQENCNLVKWLETTTGKYFRFGTMKADYSHLQYIFIYIFITNSKYTT